LHASDAASGNLPEKTAHLLLVPQLIVFSLPFLFSKAAIDFLLLLFCQVIRWACGTYTVMIGIVAHHNYFSTHNTNQAHLRSSSQTALWQFAP